MAAVVAAPAAAVGQGTSPPFNVVEATIDQVHAAFRAKRLTCRQLVQLYLDRTGWHLRLRRQGS